MTPERGKLVLVLVDESQLKLPLQPRPELQVDIQVQRQLQPRRFGLLGARQHGRTLEGGKICHALPPFACGGAASEVYVDVAVIVATVAVIVPPSPPAPVA